MKRQAVILVIIIFLILAALGLPGFSFSRSGYAASPSIAGAQSSPQAVRFVALGDAGLIGPEQTAVAARLAQVCAARGCDFALYLGDNIYPAGVDNGYDSDFEEAYEIPFRNVKLPFYVVLGNHDNSSTPIPGGDGHNNRNGDYEVEYHYRRDRMSDRWRMPARYYRVRFGDAEIFALDTNAVMENGVGTNDLGSTKQRAWLQNGLATSTARWKLATGHHPYVSNGGHGNAGSYRSATEVQGNGQNLKEFVEQTLCDQADFYLCGHDHHLEWLKPVAACGKTQFIVSGAGSDGRPLGTNINQFYFQAGDVAGFWWIEIIGDTFRAAAYDTQSNAPPLHEQTFTKPASP